MAFTIQFDYRFDTANFFSDPARRAALEAAADQWESVIADEFDDLPVGLEFSITNPTTNGTENITLTSVVDDIIVFVGARSLAGGALGRAGPTGYSAEGDIYSARISDNFRGQGPVTDFEPWAGTLVFNTSTNWNFDLSGPVSGKTDFLSVATHEIGHILGIGTSGAFDALISGDDFVGVNAMAANGGDPVPLHDDDSHVEEGFDHDTVALDPSLTVGDRVLIGDIDKAILADIGFQVTGFTAQGSQPAIATNGGETIFGSILNDTIDGLQGNDQIQGEKGNDLLKGGAGNDTIFGESGNDTLEGGGDSDQLQGGSGNDDLRGGAGADTLFGQSGIDTFVVGLGDGTNTIIDFDLNNETIRLVDSGFASISAVLSAISKPFSNVSRLTLSDGTKVDVFHNSQGGTPLDASHFELANSGGGNSAPSGAPTISGNATQGASLTASMAGISDADGLGAFSYVWLRDGSTISGATAQQYTLTQDDVGDRISVRVSYTDGQGTGESLTSAQTVQIQNVNDPLTGAVTISGGVLEGGTLSANTGALADVDGLGAFTYAWLRDGSATGDSGASYALDAADIGARISVRVSYSDGQGTAETTTSAQTAQVQNVNDTPTGTVTINGSLIEGGTLSANANSVNDADGLGAFSFAWLRDGSLTGDSGTSYVLDTDDIGARLSVRVSYVDGQGTSEAVTSSQTGFVQNANQSPQGNVVINGATSEGAVLSADASGITDGDGLGAFSYAWLRDGAATGVSGTTYALDGDDIGARMSVRVSYTDGQNTSESVTSAQTSQIENVNDDPSGGVTINGSTLEGATLTANTSGISDADGLGAFSFAWLRDGSATGDTGNSYTLDAADIGARISVRANYTDGQGTDESLTSGQTAQIQNVNDDPAGTITISGALIEGATLSANTSGIADADGLGALTIAWLRDGVATGDTGGSYTLDADDINARISVQVSYTDGQGTDEALTSPETAMVQNLNDAPQGSVTISGNPSEGETLSADASSLSDADGLGSFSYVWLRDGTPFGATGSTYQLTADDLDAALSVAVSYTDGLGTSESVTSGATGPIGNVNDAPTGGVTISGTLTQGQQISANTSSLADADGLGAFSFVWQRDGPDIPGATGGDYTLTQNDVGAQMSVRVSYQDGQGTPESVTSAATSEIQNVNDVPTGSPRIDGTAVEGNTLTADTTELADPDGLGAFAFSWLRDDVPTGSTGSNYVVGPDDVDAAISLVVSYTDGQGTLESVTSAPTTPVQNVNANPTGTLSILGTPAQMETLTADNSDLDDPDGLGTLNYVWLRDGAPIDGATANTYTLTQDDVGTQISLRGTYIDGQGTGETVISAATAEVTNVNDQAIGSVLIDGAAAQGQTLSANTITLEDLDGLGAFSFAWMRDGATIMGATQAGYALTQDDVGARITAQVSFVDGFGAQETRLSGQTEPVININDLPTGSVDIIGEAVQGGVLSADTSALQDADGLGEFSYTWLRDSGTIIDQTGQEYTLVEADVDAVIRVRVSYRDGFDTLESVTSAATTAVQSNDNVLEGDAGDNQLTGGDGEDTLSGGSGDDTLEGGGGADLFDINPGDERIEITDFEVGVDRLDLSGFARADALDAFYNLDPDDLTLEFADGTILQLSGSGLSAQTFTIENVAFASGNLPAEGEVTLLGDPFVGDTLNADVRGVTDGDGVDATTARFQWLRDGAPIAGATAAVYVVSEADLGAAISVSYLFEDNFNISESVTSGATVPVTFEGQTFEGDETANALVGGMGDDNLIGNAGDDTLTGGGGDDNLQGGAGLDTARFSGDQVNYTLTFSPDGITVADRRAGGDGIDTLDDIDFAEFSPAIPAFDSGAIDLGQFGGPSNLTADELEAVVELYIAYFNRAPDAVGLFFWATAFADGTSLDEMASLFIDQDETRAAYPPGTSNEAFAETVYNNVLGRVPDIGGLNFWVGVLDGGTVERDAFIREVLLGAKADPPPGATAEFIAQQGEDREYLATKTDIGAYFAVHKGMSDTENAAQAMALFDGTFDSIADATDAIDDFFADASAVDTGEFLMPLIGVLDDPFTM